MNLYGELDLSAFFGVEIRVLDGEEHICIPKRFNPSIIPFNGGLKVLLDIQEMKAPDKDGFTHVCRPHIPKARLGALPEADYVKMTSKVGRFRAFGLPPKEEEETDNELGFRQLARNPITDKDIPL